MKNESPINKGTQIRKLEKKRILLKKDLCSVTRQISFIDLSIVMNKNMDTRIRVRRLIMPNFVEYSVNELK